MTMFVQLATVQAKERMTVLLAINAKELVAIQNSTGMTIMSKQIDALKLALEALQEYVDEYGPWSDDSGAQYVLRVGKEVLAQLEQGWTPERIAGMKRLKDAQDKKLEQPEQEFVAWSYWQSCLNDDGTQTAPWVHRLSKFKPTESIINKDVTPLYTTPPQRTWVGLDEEDDIDWEEGGSLRDLVKAVEAKLRSKNNG